MRISTNFSFRNKTRVGDRSRSETTAQVLVTPATSTVKSRKLGDPSFFNFIIYRIARMIQLSPLPKNSILSAISQNYHWSKGQLISYKHAVSTSKNIKFNDRVGINQKESTIHNQRKHNLASIKLH